MSGRNTPWSQRGSSLPSDRILAPKPAQKGASKGKQKEPSAPRSRAVRRLEQLKDGIVALGEGTPVKDPKGGCYCQARDHDLSSHTPVCMHCGLILCSVNLPYYACPHCKTGLLTLPARHSLIKSLEEAIDATLAREEAEREHALEEARKAAGAFPTLAAAASGGVPEAPPVPQTHKVMSLGKKVTVTSYTKAKPQQAQKTQGRNAEPVEPEPIRRPAPPVEVSFIANPPNPARPWLDARQNGRAAPVYVPDPAQAGQSTQLRKRNPEKKGGENKKGIQQASDRGSTSTPR